MECSATTQTDKNGDRHVPLIDMSRPDDVTSEELYTALSTVGFACLTNTDVWQKARDYCDSAKEFFKLPLVEKEKYKKPACAEDDGGWVSIGREKLSEDRPGDYKEAFNSYLQLKGNRERMPCMIDQDILWQLWDSFAQLTLRVNYLIGLGLKLQDPYFLASTHSFNDVTKNSSSTRVLWYPRLDDADMIPGQIRCGEHSDYGSVTLLYSDSPGLQIKHSETGEFVDAGHVDGGIFVNIGDLLQMWSGDKLKATVHRVLNPIEEKYMKTERFSVVFFAQPDDEAVIETLDGSGKYPTVTSGGWLTERFQATYDIKE